MNQEAHSIEIERVPDAAYSYIEHLDTGVQFPVRTAAMRVTLTGPNGDTLSYHMTRDQFYVYFMIAMKVPCDA